MPAARVILVRIPSCDHSGVVLSNWISLMFAVMTEWPGCTPQPEAAAPGEHGPRPLQACLRTRLHGAR